MFTYATSASEQMQLLIPILYKDISLCCSSDIKVTIKQDKNNSNHLGIWFNCAKCADLINPASLQKIVAPLSHGELIVATTKTQSTYDMPLKKDIKELQEQDLLNKLLPYED